MSDFNIAWRFFALSGKILPADSVDNACFKDCLQILFENQAVYCWWISALNYDLSLIFFCVCCSNLVPCLSAELIRVILKPEMTLKMAAGWLIGNRCKISCMIFKLMLSLIVFNFPCWVIFMFSGHHSCSCPVPVRSQAGLPGGAEYPQRAGSVSVWPLVLPVRQPWRDGGRESYLHHSHVAQFHSSTRCWLRLCWKILLHSILGKNLTALSKKKNLPHFYMYLCERYWKWFSFEYLIRVYFRTVFNWCMKRTLPQFQVTDDTLLSISVSFL